MEDKIDIHGLEKGYKVAIDSLMKDQGLDERSRELIIKFERDCKLGNERIPCLLQCPEVPIKGSLCDTKFVG